jgi:integrase
MQLCLTAYNQDQHKFDFAATLYQTLTVVLPGKQIIVDFQTGQVSDQLIENQPSLATADLVARFQDHQRKRGLGQSTMASYRSVLIALAVSVPEWPPTAEAIDTFLERYRGEKYSKVTLAEYWARLNTWFNWTQQMGYLGTNPMLLVTRPDLPTIEAEPIRPQDFIKVINFLRETIATTQLRQRTLLHERAVRDLAIIRFAYSTGCRIGEIAQLKLSDLDDMDQYTVNIRAATTKGRKKKGRDACLGRQARYSLDLWLEIRPDIGDRVFIGTLGNGWAQKPLTPSGIYLAWQQWQAQAGIGPYKFHQIRHSHITHSMNNGIPIHHISRQAGHSKPDITLRIYTHSQDPERRRAYSEKNPDDTLEG